MRRRHRRLNPSLGFPTSCSSFSGDAEATQRPGYRKVAKGKSPLKVLIAAQTFSQTIGFLWVLLSSTNEKAFDRFDVLASSIGFISLLVGELGRRRSQGIFLRLYVIMSSVAAAFSVARVICNDSFLKAIQYKNVSAMTNYELVEVLRVSLGLVLQIGVIITTTALVRNMSPPKRSS